jgi:hypothetical protein
LVNKDIFREFHSSQEADEWAIHNFGQWIKDIRDSKDNLDRNSVAYLLYAYSGNMNIIYNRFLRGFKDFDEDESKEYSRDIAIIAKEISKFELQDNIIVYRYTNRKWFGYLFQGLKPRLGKMFTDKGFMSTTLVPQLLKEFAKNHRYNCILKLYLPKGTKGAYLKFDNSILNEQEFLLPLNSTFRLIRKRLSLKYGMVYECELISQ